MLPEGGRCCPRVGPCISSIGRCCLRVVDVAQGGALKVVCCCHQQVAPQVVIWSVWSWLLLVLGFAMTHVKVYITAH